MIVAHDPGVTRGGKSAILEWARIVLHVDQPISPPWVSPGISRRQAAERASKAGVKEVVFDRGAYIYHGRVKALAEAAREGGLSF